ncbi:MAG TPA: M48 family metalloprotease [Mycobacteriales bacterium]|nr:M48 family metalloprotease [Mycobacteriales bacterium]
MTSRTAALIALLVLGAALVGAIALTTPWQPLGADPPAESADPGRDFSSPEIAREVAFHDAVRPPGLTGFVVVLVVAGVLGLTPLGARLVGAAGRVGGGRWALTVVAGSAALTLALTLVRLPFSARAELARRRFGLSTQDWSGWTVDVAKSAAVSATMMAVLLLGVVLLARRSPDWWWAWAAGAAAMVVVVVSFAYPVVVEPIFNRFTPMAAGELRDSLLELAERDGVSVDDVLVADASRRTTALNAYVSGLGATRRIVVYDTLVRQASPEEVRLVVAHELGHVVEDDVRDGTLMGALGAAAAMPLLFLLLGWGPLLRRAGVSGVADPRSLALVAFLITAVTTVTGPVQSLVSRRVEARADVHSLDLTRDPMSFVASERRLAVTNLSDLEPNRALYLLFASHPSAPERIALARAWALRVGLPVPPDLVPGSGGAG